jgi:tRNA(Ile)-lysidine synthase
MNVRLEPGKYIVAVSGGVDSMALLHMLQATPGIHITVAHFNHGIRKDSAEDQSLVQQLAESYRLPFVAAEGHLGPNVSEAAARQARYDFLHGVRTTAGARAIVTAHHQNDALETAILNILRGTGRHGLTSLQSTDLVKRPLLNVSKAEIVKYARDNQLQWREDSTNLSDSHLRNYIRHKLLVRFEPANQAWLRDLIVEMRETNAELDQALTEMLRTMTYNHKLHLRQFVLLQHALAREIMAAWLRINGITETNKKMLERLTHAAKTFGPGQSVNVSASCVMKVSKDYLALGYIER